MSTKFGFIGAGKIAFAMAKGLVAQNVVKASNVIASAPKLIVSNTLDNFRAIGCNATFNNLDVCNEADVIFLTTKASVFPVILKETRDILDPKRHMLISVAAGVTLKQLSTFVLTNEVPLVRSMPNTPMLLGNGAGAYCINDAVTKSHKELIHKIFSSVGYFEEVPEHLMDAVCGLSGSGPAYVYIFIDALTDGGVRMGIPRDLALKLAVNTVAGAAQMVANTGTHPSQLKDDVCSPGGSTITAIHTLDTAGFRGLVIDAVKNATERTTQLASDVESLNGKVQ